MKFVLRAASAADASAVAALHAANWRSAYANVLDPGYLAGPVEADRQTLWTRRLTAPDASQEVILAESADGALAGFTCLYHAHDPRWGALVDNLHSSAAARGTGVGKALLFEGARRVAARDPANGIWLWVYEKNRAARGFYEALGGSVVERKEQDWEHAHGEILLRCHWASAGDLAARERG